MHQVKLLTDIETAVMVGDFLTGPHTFDQTWAPQEKGIVKKAPLDSLRNPHHSYWYVEFDNQIVAAAGVRENKYGSGGYEMDQDYIAVHRDYRGRGLATLLLVEIEKFVKENNGRYLHVLTCDIDSYVPARAFYEKHGYRKVSHIPNYYVANEGRIDYFKEF